MLFIGIKTVYKHISKKALENFSIKFLSIMDMSVVSLKINLASPFLNCNFKFESIVSY